MNQQVWGDRHTWHSWREHYVKKKGFWNKMILQQLNKRYRSMASIERTRFRDIVDHHMSRAVEEEEDYDQGEYEDNMIVLRDFEDAIGWKRGGADKPWWEKRKGEGGTVVHSDAEDDRRSQVRQHEEPAVPNVECGHLLYILLYSLSPLLARGVLGSTSAAPPGRTDRASALIAISGSHTQCFHEHMHCGEMVYALGHRLARTRHRYHRGAQRDQAPGRPHRRRPRPAINARGRRYRAVILSSAACSFPVTRRRWGRQATASNA